MLENEDVWRMPTSSFFVYAPGVGTIAVLENSVGFDTLSHSWLQVSNHVIARSRATKQSPLTEIKIATLRSQ
jgi:hypothetical protein